MTDRDTSRRWPPPGGTLPVDEVLPELRAALATGTSAVLQAPPGAGKTTHVPLALVDEQWLGGAKILMLEPRRLAARAVTHRMAQLLGERVAETVGYRVRHDTRVGPATRIEVVTEGVLTRMLQSDPALNGVGLLIFDEFHERSIHADTGLALALHSRSLVRPDLRILVMSATLDGVRVAALLGGAPIITSEGRAYPVEIEHRPRPDHRAMANAVASTVLHSLERDEGDILVFLPGGSEIRRVASLLERRVPERVRVERLYGDLSQQSQDAAIAPAAAGWRKVVLSTPIAETSLTIEGVSVVVDSGLARAPRFSPRTGMTRLETVRVSRSSANQRAGRAGRTRAGRCYRLWPEFEHHHLAEHSQPEILQSDLAALVLELALAGITDVNELAWIDTPPSAAWAHSTTLLQVLGALDESGRITAHGRAMAALPTHPRIAHMLVASRAIGATSTACDIAALLEERDPVRSSKGVPDADIEIRLQLLGNGGRDHVPGGVLADEALVRRIRAESGALRRQLGASRGVTANTEVAPGVVLALAYPDRIAQSRGNSRDGRFLLRNSAGATLTHPQALSAAEFIVAAELDGDAKSSRIFLAAALSRAELEQYFADQIEREAVIEWDERSRSVRALARERIGAIVLGESNHASPDAGEIAAVLRREILRAGIAALPWDAAALELRARMGFMHAHDDAWPDVSDTALEAQLDEWLGDSISESRSIDELRDALAPGLRELMTWEQRVALERLAPVHFVAPTGTRVPIDYTDPGSPSIAVRLQEMFGVRDTPAVNSGRMRLTIALLSPARRPIQVTRDLARFWSGSYFEVRKELRGRYPKHPWPDDPVAATPTTRAKPRGT